MTTFVFPGQGSQFVGMSKDFYDNSKIAKETFDEIQEYVNIDLKKIIFEGKDDLINITKYTQISIFTASLVIYKTLLNETKFNKNEINVMLGHSLGEYTALACSEKLSLIECSKILKKRGELMDGAVKNNQSGMAALIGQNSSFVENLISKNKINLQIANDNSPTQVVISGDLEEINKNKDFFLQNDIKKYIVLNVSAAFHSKFMNNAQDILCKDIDSLNFKKTNIRLISNFSADISNDSIVIKNALKKQMASKVKWTESIKKLEEIGEKKIIEIGPNKVLSNLIKRISSNFDIISINSFEDLKFYE